MKYGKIESGVPDHSQDIAALKSLLEKGELTREKYNHELSKIARAKMTYIARTNGAYTPSKKSLAYYDQMVNTIQEQRDKAEADKLLTNREEFLKEMNEAYDKKEEAVSTEVTDDLIPPDPPQV